MATAAGDNEPITTRLADLTGVIAGTAMIVTGQDAIGIGTVGPRCFTATVPHGGTTPLTVGQNPCTAGGGEPAGVQAVV